jgi:hypothetical protein
MRAPAERSMRRITFGANVMVRGPKIGPKHTENTLRESIDQRMERVERALNVAVSIAALVGMILSR